MPIIFTLILLFLTTISAMAGEDVVRAPAEGVTIGSNCIFSWKAPMQNTDGTPLTDLKEYRLYITQTKGVYDLTKPAGPPITAPSLQTTCQAAGITTDGQYYGAVTAVDQQGRQSMLSNEVAFARDTTAPMPPTTFNVIMQLQGIMTIVP